jgi:hypothetical protein
MAIYRAHFRWPLPPKSTTVAGYAEVLARSAGYPCSASSVRGTSAGLAAILSFPGVAKNNLIELSGDICLLEFAPIAFFWAHATRSVQELGGVFTGPVISDRQDWTGRQWKELKWTERGLIQLGFGSSII